MAVPDFQSFMLPILQIAADGQEHPVISLREKVTSAMKLSAEDLDETLPSGTQKRYLNRIYWSIVYLAKAGVLKRPRRGVILITDRGRELLSENHPKITVKILQRFPEFLEFNIGDGGSSQAVPTPIPGNGPETEQTPEEGLESNYQEIHNSLATEVLEAVKKCTPRFFEDLVVNLLVAMGYGGSIEDAGRAVGRSGDEGIDGIIKEDKLGLDFVYIQAKKYADTTVGRPAVQAFAGSLEGHRARKGVMISTSTFSQDAREYVKKIEKKIVLIDGRQLAELMVENNVGVTLAKTYRVKKLDQDFFESE